MSATTTRITIATRRHCLTTVESAIRFGLWARRRPLLTAEDVMVHLGCSRSTAYRYLRAYKSATGLF